MSLKRLPASVLQKQAESSVKHQRITGVTECHDEALEHAARKSFWLLQEPDSMTDRQATQTWDLQSVVTEVFHDSLIVSQGNFAGRSGLKAFRIFPEIVLEKVVLYSSKNEKKKTKIKSGPGADTAGCLQFMLLCECVLR